MRIHLIRPRHGRVEPQMGFKVQSPLHRRYCRDGRYFQLNASDRDDVQSLPVRICMQRSPIPAPYGGLQVFIAQ